MDELQYVSQDKAMRAEYEARQKEISDFNAGVANARKEEREKAEKREKQLVEKAKAEKIEPAKKILTDGLSEELVSKYKVFP